MVSRWAIVRSFIPAWKGHSLSSASCCSCEAIRYWPTGRHEPLEFEVEWEVGRWHGWQNDIVWRMVDTLWKLRNCNMPCELDSGGMCDTTSKEKFKHKIMQWFMTSRAITAPPPQCSARLLLDLLNSSCQLWLPDNMQSLGYPQWLQGSGWAPLMSYETYKGCRFSMGPHWCPIKAAGCRYTWVPGLRMGLIDVLWRL